MISMKEFWILHELLDKQLTGYMESFQFFQKSKDQFRKCLIDTKRWYLLAQNILIANDW